MHYLDKQSAKVKISRELENNGWKVYGFHEDQSDMMIDYYHPASWDGIAEKNGFVLLVDVYGTYASGKAITERNPDAAKVNHERIQKLHAKANDEAAPEAEREACRGRIAVEMKKLENQTITVGHFPLFSQGNPKGATWHIEKDGQIVAKGNGVYSVIEYDWEDKTKSKGEQIKENINKLVSRFEQVLKDSDALKPEIITVSKKVIKPIQKQENTINVGDILSLSYHGHYWIVTDVYTVGGQERATYELLGSEKRGYNRLSGTSVKRYYQPMAQLMKELKEGKTKVYTLQEVTVFEEKTVYKKTGRKQTKKENAIAITGEVEEVEEEAQEQQHEVNADNITVALNEEFNGVEIRFSDKPEQVTIEALKAHGFRWSKRGFWFAKQSADTMAYAETLKGPKEHIEAHNSDIEEEQRETVIINDEVEESENMEEQFTTENEEVNEENEHNKIYVLNRETGKIELQFTKAEYKALSNEQKQELKRFYNFSRYASAWVSKGSNNHYSALRVAEKLGFVNGGKVGERLSYAEEVERQTERAEARAERYEQHAENAQKRGERMQSEFNENRKDWSWLTQPNINSSKGRAFTNQRNRIMERYNKGFEEYRKSEYFRERSITAQGTASGEKFKDKTYLNNRIEECNKNIRDLERAIVRAEEANNEKRLEDLLEKTEYEIDKLAYLQNCLDDIGGIQYNNSNLKPGYLVKIRGRWDTVVKANTKTVETQSKHVPYTLKYPYAEIQDMKIPEGWTEPKTSITENPFNCGDIMVTYNAMGNRVIRAYQIVGTTDKSVNIQEIKIVDGVPVTNDFKSDKTERRAVKKDRSGNIVVNHDSYYLFKYNQDQTKAV